MSQPKPTKSSVTLTTPDAIPVTALSTDVATYPARIAELLSPFKGSHAS